MKYSKQKELILKAVKECHVHPTADEVYFMLKMENPNLSLGTVYRNLNKFAEKGDLLKIQFPGGPDRFDGNTIEHFHMKCTECGKISDVFVNEMPIIKSDDLEGCEVEYCDIYFQGTCKLCQQS